MKSLVLCLIASAVWGQTIVNPTQGPPPDAFTTLLYYDGSNNVEYACKAKAIQPSFSWTRSATTLTNIIVATNVGTATTSSAHGLAVGNPVTVSGATVDTDLNGTYYVQTIGSSTTFTITTASVADATYNESTLAVATVAPRTTAAVWDIVHYNYTTSYVSAIQKAGGKAGLNSICANRATSTGSTKITFQ